ncbi:hypothetical protein J8273_1623 [Carpediemonas membranifera]|uniref:Uncharacterized protein n=1 Tax=Carpediemonas membranifera TaxID=201153 RepID=A0A8J6C0I2_9EUKA|nr:hypothetical protein J8273_1623 [Carpediemonas membranifera]|eukprot:KAG9396606.1 hypothetical protein J8273_1623 [Carpediemonas membranifera]
MCGLFCTSSPKKMEKETNKHNLVAIRLMAISLTAQIPGDVPSLLSRAYELEYGGSIPANVPLDMSRASIADILIILEHMRLRKPRAMNLIDRARAILTDGPPMSMNIELSEGKKLPVAFHTLLQGTIWAVLMRAGADPDLAPRAEASGKNGKGAPLESSCMWFLCRKTRFTHTRGEVDGLTRARPVSGSPDQVVLFRGYLGRLFTKGYTGTGLLGHRAPERTTAVFRPVNLPPLLDLHVSDNAAIAVTSLGLYGWGDAAAALGFGGNNPAPTRLTFPACPELQAFEAGLDAGFKYQLASRIAMTASSDQCAILTPVGLAVADVTAPADDAGFRMAVLPGEYKPDDVAVGRGVLLAASGSRSFITGDNGCGRLGLGHTRPVAGFERLPFTVDRLVAAGSTWLLLLSGTELLFAGQVNRLVSEHLPDIRTGDVLSEATPLSLPGALAAVGGTADALVLVWADSTSTVTTMGQTYAVHAEVTAAYVLRLPICTAFLRTQDGWVGVGGNLNAVLSGAGRLTVDEAVPVPASRVRGSAVDLVAVGR